MQGVIHSGRSVARITSFLILLVALLTAAPTAGAAIDGKLKQLPLPVGCLDDAAAQACANIVAPMTNVGEPAFDPSGRFVYVPARDSDTLNWFERNTSTGALTERGCLRSSTAGAAAGCTLLTASPLEDATGADVSTDGDGLENLYVVGGAAGGSAPDGIVTFTLGTDGTPTFEQCINSNGAGGCTIAPALANPVAVTVSPDGNSVYVVSFDAHAIAVFQRSRATGLLSQATLTPAQKCLRRDAGESCTVFPRLEQPRDVAVTPDNKQVIVVSPGCQTFNGCYTLAALDRSSTTSVLTAQADPQGCVSTFTFVGCTFRPGGWTAPNQVAITNDGLHMLVAGRSNAVMTVDRDPGTGDVTAVTPCTKAPASTLDCAQESKALAGLHDIELSPDNQYVYTAGYEGQRIGIFGRSGDQLVLRPGDFGCLAASNQTDSCGGIIQGGTNTNVEYVLPSPDGKHVYGFGSGGGIGKIFSFAVDHAPQCSNLSVSTPHNTAVSMILPCSDQDGDPLTWEIVSHPAKGTLGALQGSQVTYGPFLGTSGPDTFTFRVVGAGVPADTMTVTVNVAGPVAPPPPPPPPPPPVRRCKVPKVIGLKTAVAKTRIRRANCSVGRVRTARSKKAKRGRVISQSPRPGVLRARGTNVTLVVGRR